MKTSIKYINISRPMQNTVFMLIILALSIFITQDVIIHCFHLWDKACTLCV